MRTIYENYRGFTVCQLENKYKATRNEVSFSHRQLIELLNSIDQYVEDKSR